MKELDCEIIELQTFEENKLINGCRDADAIMLQCAPITDKVIKELKRCKVISRCGIGVDSIDIKAASSANILVCNAPDCNVDEVADHALSLMLCLGRKIINLSQSVRNGDWVVFAKSKEPVFNFRHLTLGIIGFGKIAQNLYQKAKCIFKDIIIYDPYLSGDVMDKYVLKIKSFEDLLSNSDFITIHCPLNESTFHLFDEREFKLMKPTSYIINTSRGSIVNSKALLNALTNNQIAGAGLDVLEKEPPDFEFELSKLKNVIITPHAAHYSKTSFECVKYKSALNVLKVLKNEEPINVVNYELLADRK